MNIAAQFKQQSQQRRNKSKKNNYVVNLSFNIPVKPEKLLIDEPLSGEFTITKNNIQKSLKLNVDSSRMSGQTEGKKFARTDDIQLVHSGRNTKKTHSRQGSKTNQVPTRHSRNLSCTNTYSKSPSRIVQKNQKGTNSTHTTYLKKLPKQIMSTLQDDNIVGYTNPSSQLKYFNDSNKIQNKIQEQSRISKSPLVTPALQFLEKNEAIDTDLISQIKKYEQAAQEKKKHMNFQYIKQKILVHSSARKIQRAWRRYKTQKIIHSYSNIDPIKKFKKNLDSGSFKQFYEPKILNVKSCGYKNGKNEMKRSIKKSKEYFFHDVKPMEEQEKGEQDQKQIIAEKKKIQMQQIEKWEELIKEVRKNKNIDQVLMKVEQHRKDITFEESKQPVQKSEHQPKYEEIQKTMAWFESRPIFPKNSSIESKNKEQSLLNEKSKSQKEIFKNSKQALRVEQNLLSQDDLVVNKKRLETYLDNLQFIEQVQSHDEKIIKIQSKEKQQRKASQIFNRLSKVEQDALNEINERKRRFQEINQEIDSINSYLLQNKKRNQEKRLKSEKKHYSKELKDSILFEIEMGLILEAGVQMREKLKQKQLLKEKQEGICTNIESIKDYLENLISFILQQDPETMLQGFNTPIGANPIQFLRSMRTQNQFELKSQSSQKKQVFKKQLFYRHWNFASDQIYFEAKYKNKEKQSYRIKRLKEITKVYFESLFDSFNQCLQPFRRYGLRGEPFPWEIKAVNESVIYDVQFLKPFIKQAYKNLSDIAAIFCGIYAEEKKPKLPKQIVYEIQQERMCIFLEHQIRSSEWTWNKFNKEFAQVLCLVASSIAERLLIEAISQLKLLQDKNQNIP